MSVVFLNMYKLRFHKLVQLLTQTNNTLEKKVKKKTLERTKVLQMQKDELHYQAHHDYLTKLPNRVKLENEVLNNISRSQEENQSLYVLFINLDHFKKINDSFGHPVGDEVLKCIHSKNI